MNGSDNCLPQEDGSYKGGEDRHYVDGELEYEEFSDRVVYVASPDDSVHNPAEIVVSQDNVRR